MRLRTPLTKFNRSSRLLRSTTPTASAAPTSSSSSRRTSSSLCPTVPPSLPARSCSPTRGPLLSRKCEVWGSWGRSVRLNDYVMATACMKDKDCAENTACIYGPDNGKDGFDVSLVLCKRPFQVISKKRGSIFFRVQMSASHV